MPLDPRAQSKFTFKDGVPVLKTDVKSKGGEDDCKVNHR